MRRLFKRGLTACLIGTLALWAVSALLWSRVVVCPRVLSAAEECHGSESQEQQAGWFGDYACERLAGDDVVDTLVAGVVVALPQGEAFDQVAGEASLGSEAPIPCG